MKAQSGFTPKVAGVAIPLGWVVVALFVVTICLFGGSSRPDAVQIAALRPLSAILLIPALYAWSAPPSKEVRLPLLLLGLLLVWMVVQLIPLPPFIWQSLPDRNIVASLDSLAGIDDAWRPISMVPTRSINALAGLIVPIAAMAIALAFRMATRDLLLIICAVGLLDAFVGFAQLATGPSSPFYFYAITNRGFAVGLFANENHSAVLSAIVMLTAARLGLSRIWTNELPWLRVFAAVAYTVALLAVIVSGSRAGLVTGLFGFAGSVIMGYLAVSHSKPAQTGGFAHTNPKRAGNSRATQSSFPGLKAFGLRNPGRALTLAVVAISIVGALFVVNGRAAGLEGLLNEDSFSDLRWQLWPTLQVMIAAHWQFGIGFGAFEEAYHIYEPTELLYSVYVNQAHNDLAQAIIEGGVVLVALFAFLLLWIIGRLRTIFAGGQAEVASVVYWLVLIMLLAAASLVDYPLRAPVYQALVAWLVIALAFDAPSSKALR